MNTNMDKPHLVITGATGYIGSELVMMALKQNWKVTAFSRKPLLFQNVGYKLFDLSTPVDELPLPVTALIHLAADTTGQHVTEEVEIAAAIQLAKIAAESNVRFIFISSQSASPQAPTRYGRVKWIIEQSVKELGGIVVRPGLVYGGTMEKGLYATLVQLVRKMPVLPRLVPSPLVQPVYIKDLCSVLLKLASTPIVNIHEYNIASKEVSFNDFMRSIAVYRLNRYRLFIPIPTLLLSTVATVLGRLNANFTPLATRIKSLLSLKPMLTEDSLAALNINLMDLSDGLVIKKNLNRRQLAREGWILFYYLLREKPKNALLVRYVRAIKFLFHGKVLHLPRLLYFSPRILRFLDKSIFFKSKEVSKEQDVGCRLDVALAIATASKTYADKFIMKKNSSKIFIFLSLMWILAVELIMQLFKVFWRK